MVLRITPSQATVKLEGRLAGAYAELLERECTALFRAFAQVTLDLSDVSVVDRSGVDVLGRLSRAGVAIRGCSDVIASILASEGIPTR